MINLPFTLLLLLWLVAAGLAIWVLFRIRLMPKAVRWEKLEGQVAELEKRKELLEPEVLAAQQLTAHLGQLREDSNILSARVETLELEKQQLEPMAKQVAELEIQLAQKHEELSTIDANKQKLLEEVATHYATRKAEEERVYERKRKVTELAKKEKALRDESAKLEKSLSSARHEHDKTMNCIREIKDKVSREEVRFAELKMEMQKTQEALDAMTEQHSRLKGESQALDKEIAERTKHLEALKQDHKNAGGGNGEDPMMDLWVPYFARSAKICKERDEQKRMSALSGQLKTRGLVFADRTLNAFHTALKVADISPLTVLSGISGTGKSLLPRVYAETMGIHFLGLAVQPRWDSPQDMFGFYNYMEHKYKATELARAMVQFERYNKMNQVGELRDQVLMVLLDEMNLARVEYYFSEFLSKLEVRRDIDPNKSEERKKVEIALELGHGNDEYKTVRLYPDRNVLFVGTMNEDESTQNLSDKVLDRACVLRFGKPNKLKVDRDVNNGRAVVTEKMLSQKVWAAWCNIDSQEPSSYVLETIERLNEVMAMVGKPFAHRVGQAIGSYTLNYPVWVAGHEKKALADQVEQRILPKLRGLNVSHHHDAFDKLSALLAELEDPVLAKAFNCGRERKQAHGMSSFIWQGVDRSENGG